jgi:gentisate 1,2-dioxygenase
MAIGDKRLRSRSICPRQENAGTTLTDAVPSWASRRLNADTGLDIFVTNDARVLEVLALSRTEVIEVSR